MGIAGRGCSTGRGPARHRPPPCRGHTAGSPPGRRCRVAFSRFGAGQSEPWAHAVVLKPVSPSISSVLPPLVTRRLAGAAPARGRASAPSQTERRFSCPLFLAVFLLSARGESACLGGAWGLGGAAPHHLSICGRGDRRSFLSRRPAVALRPPGRLRSATQAASAHRCPRRDGRRVASPLRRPTAVRPLPTSYPTVPRSRRLAIRAERVSIGTSMRFAWGASSIAWSFGSRRPPDWAS